MQAGELFPGVSPFLFPFKRYLDLLWKPFGAAVVFRKDLSLFIAGRITSAFNAIFRQRLATLQLERRKAWLLRHDTSYDKVDFLPGSFMCPYPLVIFRTRVCLDEITRTIHRGGL